MFRFLLIYCLLTAVIARAPFHKKSHKEMTSGRIIGGEETTIQSYPYQISLLYNRSASMGFDHDCGGSIISPSYILTAAHCVTNRPLSRMMVRAGSARMNSGGSLHQVARAVVHEEFRMSPTPVNDVALLRLARPLHLDETRQPIELYRQGEETVPCERATVTGWGETGHGRPLQLRVVTVPVISKVLCAFAYDGLEDGQICAAFYGFGGKDACQGDSGGPLVVGGRQAGIVSWGKGCARSEYPGVYTEVAHYRDWIRRHANV